MQMFCMNKIPENGWTTVCSGQSTEWDTVSHNALHSSWPSYQYRLTNVITKQYKLHSSYMIKSYDWIKIQMISSVCEIINGWHLLN